MKLTRQPRIVLKMVGAVMLLLVGMGLFSSLGGRDFMARRVELPPAEALTAAAAAGRLDSFADIADAVKPAVVNVGTVQATGSGPRGIKPYREFLERYFGQSLPPEEPRRSLGSGVIVDPDGFILTNHHVIVRGCAPGT